MPNRRITRRVVSEQRHKRTKVRRLNMSVGPVDGAPFSFRTEKLSRKYFASLLYRAPVRPDFTAIDRRVIAENQELLTRLADA